MFTTKEPFRELCELFNNETDNCKKMDKYTTLLKEATTKISDTFKKKGNQKLSFDRGATIIPIAKQIKEMDDFELITWLIVR